MDKRETAAVRTVSNDDIRNSPSIFHSVVFMSASFNFHILSFFFLLLFVVTEKWFSTVDFGVRLHLHVSVLSTDFFMPFFLWFLFIFRDRIKYRELFCNVSITVNASSGRCRLCILRIVDCHRRRFLYEHPVSAEESNCKQQAKRKKVLRFYWLY